MQALQKAGDASVREQAAAVLGVLSDAGRRADIIAAGGVEALVELLRYGTEEGRVEAARAIDSVADDASSHAALQAALPRLIELAGLPGAAQDPSQSTLHKLSSGDNAEVQAALAQSDSATLLLCQQLLGDDAEERQAAVTSLLKLSEQPAALRSIVEGGGVPPLVEMAQVTGTSRWLPECHPITTGLPPDCRLPPLSMRRRCPTLQRVPTAASTAKSARRRRTSSCSSHRWARRRTRTPSLSRAARACCSRRRAID